MRILKNLSEFLRNDENRTLLLNAGSDMELKLIMFIKLKTLFALLLLISLHSCSAQNEEQVAPVQHPEANLRCPQYGDGAEE